MTKILLIGDVFGRPGREMMYAVLPGLIEEKNIDLVIANGENAAGGKGITPMIVQEFFDCGVDVISSGNHVRDKKEIDVLLAQNPKVMRPFNYPDSMPGNGVVVVEARNKRKIAVLNAIGKVHMGNHESPFVKIKSEVVKLSTQTNCIVVDFHAEATSEKRAMGWFLDGLVSAVLGTHTHVQTADEEILPYKTAYITDVGMTGPHNSVIGLKTEIALDRFIYNTKEKFEVGQGDVRFNGVIVDVDEKGRASSIERVCIRENKTLHA